MAQLSMSDVGLVNEKTQGHGRGRQYHVVFTTTTAPRSLTGPMAVRPVCAVPRERSSRGLPRTCMIPLAWPRVGGHGKNGIFSGLDWLRPSWPQPVIRHRR